MNEKKDFRSIQELADGVKANVDELANGTLSLEGIDAVVNEMRELYERLVVIRHGAILKEESGTLKEETGNVKAEGEGVEEEKKDISAPPAYRTGRLDDRLNEQGESDPPVNEGLFKLDIEKPIENEVPVNQTSIIDQIEELAEENVHEKMADENEDTLAEKFKGGPIEDLKSAIGLNNKFWFIKELFNEDKKAFATALNALEAADDHASAQKWFDEEVRPNLLADHDETALRKFLELLERRYLANA